MKSWDFHTKILLGFMVFGMIIAFTMGWNTGQSFMAVANERNSIKQTLNINLEVVDKGIENSFMSFLPTRYYLLLSNDTTIYVTKQEYEQYEQGCSYNFEQIEESLVTQRIRTYKDK